VLHKIHIRCPGKIRGVQCTTNQEALLWEPAGWLKKKALQYGLSISGIRAQIRQISTVGGHRWPWLVCFRINTAVKRDHVSSA
jgi:hypothetical protein